MTRTRSSAACLLAADGRTVCDRCEIADRFATRLRGLMFRRELEAGSGLLLRPGGSVHTCFMRFSIDVVFLDRAGAVVHVARAVRPWRAARARGAKAVLELPAGEAARRGIEVGETLQLDATELTR